VEVTRHREEKNKDTVKPARWGYTALIDDAMTDPYWVYSWLLYYDLSDGRFHYTYNAVGVAAIWAWNDWGKTKLDYGLTCPFPYELQQSTSVHDEGTRIGMAIDDFDPNSNSKIFKPKWDYYMSPFVVDQHEHFHAKDFWDEYLFAGTDMRKLASDLACNIDVRPMDATRFVPAYSSESTNPELDKLLKDEYIKRYIKYDRKKEERAAPSTKKDMRKIRNELQTHYAVHPPQ
jgi:hypothetical protein